MANNKLLNIATGGYAEFPGTWMPASALRHLVFDDPGYIWLERYGESHGLKPEYSPYDFSRFVWKKGQEFEEKWISEIVPDSPRVCVYDYDFKHVEKVNETIGLIQARAPVIVKPVFWWAPERIYGVLDLIVLSGWFKDRFPGLLESCNPNNQDTYRDSVEGKDNYLVVEIKFRHERNLEKPDWHYIRSQIELYTFMLAQFQGSLCNQGILVLRDRIQSPVTLVLDIDEGQSLSTKLAKFRDHYEDIMNNGSSYMPWRDPIVAINMKRQDNADENWKSAKKEIAQYKVPGGDPCLLCHISPPIRTELARIGYPNLDTLFKLCPSTDDLQKCKGIGEAFSNEVHAILRANSSGQPMQPNPKLVPAKMEYELYVDFEELNNLNVNFSKEWPQLDGTEMVFMIGVGWQEGDKWLFKELVAEAEDWTCEKQIFEEFLNLLNSITCGTFTDKNRTAIFHWDHFERTQCKKVASRYDFPNSVDLKDLPLVDLAKVFKKSPSSVPGAFTFQLKDIATNLGRIHPEFNSGWPGDLDEGLKAMVMGWEAYKKDPPLDSYEMSMLRSYLEADCKALYCLLKWARSSF
jgi:hypothetical protein